MIHESARIRHGVTQTRNLDFVVGPPAVDPSKHCPARSLFNYFSVAGKQLRLLLIVVLISLFSFGTSRALRRDSGKVEPIGSFTEAAASDALKKVLEAKGYRITVGDGAALCDIWLRAGIAANASSDMQGVAYTTIPESSFLGVITFPKPATDFRKQGIKPGSYTMRYALHPVDGNHLGISPIRDFILLLPLAIDQNPNTKPKFEELTAMSKKASGTNHPSPLS